MSDSQTGAVRRAIVNEHNGAHIRRGMLQQHELPVDFWARPTGKLIRLLPTRVDGLQDPVD
jgi:hypothetical protein